MDYTLFLKRKEKLLIAAIELLDASGVAGVTTKEMARREHISEPAVYRHFDGKVEVLLAIVEKFAHFDSQIENTVREQEMSPLDGLRHLCSSYAVYYGSYPQLASVLCSFDLMKYDPAIQSRMTEVYANRRRQILELTAAARRAGELSADADVELLADSIASLFWGTVFQWKTMGMAFDLPRRMMDTLDLLLSRDRARTETARWME